MKNPNGQQFFARGSGLALLTALVFIAPRPLAAQSRQQIKVLVETQQASTQSSEEVRGSGSVIIRRGDVQPSARVGAGARNTTVQRSTGIFTVVQDGGESILTVATRVPASQIIFYRDYLSGLGYIAQSIVFQEAGTSLRVSALILPGNQVQLRLTPRISFFSAERSGAIDVTEATTELVVPSGQPVSLGGTTSKMHEITRRILGFSQTMATSETSMLLTATIQ